MSSSISLLVFKEFVHRCEFDRMDCECTGTVPAAVAMPILQSRLEEANLSANDISTRLDKMDSGTINFADYSRCLFGDFEIAKPDGLDYSLLGTQCTRIIGAENRAISVAQLQRILDFIKSFADEEGVLEWIDLSPPAYSAKSGQRLLVNNINLYQVCLQCGKALLFELVWYF